MSAALSRLEGPLTGAVSPEAAVRQIRTALPGEADRVGHVNNAVYLQWAQDIAVAHWSAVATPEMQAAWLWFALRHEIDYHAQLFPGDRVELRTWLGPAQGARFPRHVEIFKDGAGKPAATVVTQWGLIDAAARRPRRVPADILALFGCVQS